MKPTFRKRYYLIFFSSVLGPLATNALVPLFEQLRTHFELSSVSLISLAFFVYMFPFSIIQLFTGTFSDIIDKRKVVLGGYFIFILGIFISLSSILLKRYYLFLLAFFFQGLGFSFINPTILAISSIITPKEKEGLIMGIFNSSAGLGVSGGALLAGFLANYNWRLLFVLNPIITIISLILFAFSVRNCEALVCRSYELEENNSKVPKKAIISSFKKFKIQLKENLTSDILLMGIIGFICFFAVITMTNTLNEQMNQNIESLSDIEIANIVSLILTVNGFISITVSPITGALLKRINPISMILIGIVLLFSIILLPFSISIIMFIIVSLVIYLGSTFIWPALFQKSMNINPEAKGTNSAIINSLRFLGYSMVGAFYVILGIPLLYYCTLILIMLIFSIMIIKKRRE